MTAAERVAARQPITGWLCLMCDMRTDGALSQPVPCCSQQLAIRLSVLPEE